MNREIEKGVCFKYPFVKRELFYQKKYLLRQLCKTGAADSPSHGDVGNRQMSKKMDERQSF
jgi:hypothetical protein